MKKIQELTTEQIEIAAGDTFAAAFRFTGPQVQSLAIECLEHRKNHHIYLLASAEYLALRKLAYHIATEADDLFCGSTGITGRYASQITELQAPAVELFKRQFMAEGINYAAGRLAAGFNHGFVDKPLAEVYDVVRMIMTAKEDLANDPLPAADGLSGEYAEKSLQEFAAQLRKGGAA